MIGAVNAVLPGPLPGFLASPGAYPATTEPQLTSANIWAPSTNLQLRQIRQELHRLILQLDQYSQLGQLKAPTPVPVQTSVAWQDFFAQAWQYLTGQHPTPGPAAPGQHPAPGPAAPSQHPAPGPAAPGQVSPHGPTDFVISSFNVLCGNAGRAKGYAPLETRMQGVKQILDAHNVSVVGMQEMDYDQLAAFKRFAGGTYATFAGESGKKGYHDTTLAWRRDTWDLVKADTITVPSYEGIASKVPYVRLRNKQTGQEAYFVDAHNPANTRLHHHHERYRDAAARQEASLVDWLVKSTGLPVFMVGDMNAAKPAYDIFSQGAPLVSANAQGGRRGLAGIDWIFGSKGVQFSHFNRVRDTLVQKTTDHPVVFSNVSIKGQ